MTTEDYKDRYSHGNASASALPEPPEEIRGNAKTAFISYSTKNPEDAAFVCEWLEFNGARCWVAPRDLLAGTNFADNIEIALGNAKMLVLVLSKESATSPWVEGEINTAFSAGKPILVFQIDDVEPTGSLRVMLAKFPVIRKTDDFDTDGFALVDAALKLLEGQNVELPTFAQTRRGISPRSIEKNQPTKSHSKKCIILSTTRDWRIAQLLKNEILRAGGSAQILDVSKLPWISENKIPESYRSRVAESQLMIAVLSQELENEVAAQALLKLAFSIKIAILPYKIYVGKPSSGMSLLLGMAHWLDVSMLPSVEAGILEFRNALGIHFDKKKKKVGKAFPYILGIAGTLFAILLTILATIFTVDLRERSGQILVEAEKFDDDEENPAESVPADDLPVAPAIIAGTDNLTPPMERRNERLSKIPAKEQGNQTAILRAAWDARDLVAAERALEKGANPDVFIKAEGPAIRPILVEAARRGNVEFVELLLSYGATPDLQDAQENKRYDALTIAIAYSNGNTRAQIVELLLDYGFSPNKINNWGAPVLRDSISWNRPMVAQILMEFGADPNLAGTRGGTAIDEANKKTSDIFANPEVREAIFALNRTKSPTYGERKIVPRLFETRVTGTRKFGDIEILQIRHSAPFVGWETKKFGIGKTEVTQAQWEDVMGAGTNPSYFRGNGNLPVEQVSWKDAMEFCKKLTARERKKGNLRSYEKFTLPTREQWTLACKAGEQTQFCNDNRAEEMAKYSWFYRNSGDRILEVFSQSEKVANNCRTHPVAQKLPNDVETYDMCGNVWEMLLEKRAIGGCYDNNAGASNPDRGGFQLASPTFREKFLGFRLALVKFDPTEQEDDAFPQKAAENLANQAEFAENNGRVEVKLKSAGTQKFMNIDGRKIAVNADGNLEFSGLRAGTTGAILRIFENPATSQLVTTSVNLKMKKRDALSVTTDNLFDVFLGNGRDVGVLYVGEDGVYWSTAYNNRTQLFAGDMSEDFRAIRIGYFAGTAGAGTGFYVWVDDELVGEALQGTSHGGARNQHACNFLFGDTSSEHQTYAEVSAVSYETGKIYAPPAGTKKSASTAGTPESNPAGTKKSASNRANSANASNTSANENRNKNFSWKEIFPNGLSQGILAKEFPKNYLKLDENDLVLVYVPAPYERELRRRGKSYNYVSSFNNQEEELKTLKKLAKAFPKKLTIVANCKTPNPTKDEYHDVYQHRILLTKSCKWNAKVLLLNRRGKLLYQNNQSNFFLDESCFAELKKEIEKALNSKR